MVLLRRNIDAINGHPADEWWIPSSPDSYAHSCSVVGLSLELFGNLTARLVSNNPIPFLFDAPGRLIPLTDRYVPLRFAKDVFSLSLWQLPPGPDEGFRRWLFVRSGRASRRGHRDALRDGHLDHSQRR